MCASRDDDGEVERDDLVAQHKFLRAVREGRLRVVRRMLLRDDVAPDLVDAAGWTPLHIAALRGECDLVDILLDAGADVDAVTRDGGTPMQSAAWGGHHETLARLIASGADTRRGGRGALAVAARRGHRECARVLLDAGVAPDVEEDGYTALASALARGHVEIAELLLERGADPDGAGHGSALAVAVAQGHRELARRMLHAGADPNLPSTHGATALRTAASLGDVELASLLVSRGAALDGRGDDGEWTPLMTASSAGRERMVTWLIEQGADVARINGEGRNARTLALAGDHERVAARLAAAGAPEQPERAGEIASERAALRARRAEAAERERAFAGARPGKVASGAFAGFEGRARPAGGDQLEVLLVLFGRATTVKIRREDFEFEPEPESGPEPDPESNSEPGPEPGV